MNTKKAIKKGEKFISQSFVNKPRKLTYINYYKSCKVEKNTILYQAYANKILAGNPLAMFLYLVENPNYSHLRHIWIIKDREVLDYPDVKKYADNPKVRFVIDGTPEALKALCTAEYLVNNAAFPSYYIKKDDQIYINTWHGTPLKGLGKFDKSPHRRPIMSAQRNFLCADYLVMPNRYTSDILMEHYDVKNAFAGKIIEAGYPRVDMVLNTEREGLIKRLEQKAQTSLKGKKIILYAPTFRSELTYAKKHIDNSNEICEYIEHIVENMPENYVMFFKAHSNLISYFKENEKITNLFLFDDFETNTVLSVTDVLITDYSSVFFDYLSTKRPIIFFTYDREKYEGERGFLFPLDTLPGRLCDTEGEVVDSLVQINEGKYNFDEKYDNFINTFAYKDDGGATKRVCDIIFENAQTDTVYTVNSGKKSILLHFGSKLGKGDTACEALQVLRGIDTNEYDVFAFGNYTEKQKLLFDSACEGIRYLTHIPPTAYTVDEAVRKKALGENAVDIYDREYRRNLGLCTFDEIVNFGTNMPVYRKMLETQTDAKKTVFVRRENYSKHLVDELLKVNYEKIVVLGDGSITDTFADTRVEIRDTQGENVFADIEALNLPLKVLFVTSFDSTNYVYVNILKELENRGYKYKILVKDINDELNNLMFAGNPNLVSVANFNYDTLDEYDFVVSSPIKQRVFTKLYREIKKRGLFIYTFSTLFSSVTMRVDGDAVITIGENKFDEFRANYLKYNMIALGNPQYDALLENKKPPISPEDIKKVLFLEQGAYPCGDKGKKQLADMLINMAESNPDKEIHIKPRYLLETNSKSIHTVSEHLYNYFDRVPDNLILINENYILEDILPQYDAMITMWSTAYIDAMAMNMPLMLIGGFDSDDVFDIRTNRVNDAYAVLGDSGVLVDYRELKDKKLEIKYVDESFKKREFANFDRPCAPDIVDLFEKVNSRLLIPGKRYSGFFETNLDGFDATLDSLTLYDVTDPAYKEWRKNYAVFNTRMQEFVYINRCMGNLLDLSECTALMENLKVGDTLDMERAIDKKFAEIENAFFTEPENIKKTESDMILLDFYYDWMYRNHRYSQMKENPFSKVWAKESFEYYTALHCLKSAQQKKAIEHITNYLGFIVAKNGKTDLLKEKRLYDYIKPFLTVTVRYNFIKHLYDNKLIDELMLLNFSVLNTDSMTVYYKMKAQNELGNYEKAIAVYDLFAAAKNSNSEILKRIMKNLFTNKVEIEYNLAVESINQRSKEL